MILECTQCRTRYLVPDSAIGPEGRTVRCAACRHSWFQAAEVLDLVARAETAPPRPSSPPPTSPPSLPPPRPAAEPEPESADVAMAESGGEPGFDAFAHEPPFRQRRTGARRWMIVAIIAAIAVLAAAAAILYSSAPGLASQFGLQLGPATTPLQLTNNPIERRDLDNGSEMFAISGNVVNPTGTRQPVPDIRAELRDAQGRLVYSWTIRPETLWLPPHGSVAFNSAKLDVPVNSRKLVLSFSGEGAH